MPVQRFKSFADLEQLEGLGKGFNWRFVPDQAYRNQALRFRTHVPFPPGIHKFQDFAAADEWEREWWIRGGATRSAP